MWQQTPREMEKRKNSQYIKIILPSPSLTHSRTVSVSFSLFFSSLCNSDHGGNAGRVELAALVWTEFIFFAVLLKRYMYLYRASGKEKVFEKGSP